MVINKFRIFIGLIVLLVLFLLAAYLISSKKSTRAVNLPQAELIIKTKPVNLAPAERKIYEDGLAKAEKMWQELPKNATPSDKIKILMYSANQLYGLGRLAEARDKYLQAAILVPANYDVKIGLATVYTDMHDYQNALQAILAAINLWPERADLWRRYIELASDKLGYTNEALDSLYKEALRKTFSHVDIIALYARFLEKIGNIKSSIDQWREAVKQSPNNKLFQDEIKRLELIKPV